MQHLDRLSGRWQLSESDFRSMRCASACEAGHATRRLPPETNTPEVPFESSQPRTTGDDMSDAIVVGLLGITHPHASARVRALREIDGVEVVAAADDDSRLK